MSSEDIFGPVGEEVSVHQGSEDLFADEDEAEDVLPATVDSAKQAKKRKRKRNSSSRRIGKQPKSVRRVTSTGATAEMSDKNKDSIFVKPMVEKNPTPIDVYDFKESDSEQKPVKRQYVKRRGRFSQPKKKKLKVDNKIVLAESTEKVSDEGLSVVKVVDSQQQKDGETIQASPKIGKTITPVDDISNEGLVGNYDGNDVPEKEFIYLSQNLEDPVSNATPSSQNSDILIDQFPAETLAVQAMAFELKNRLEQSNSKWIVDTVDKSGRMFLMCHLPNVAVERSIHWNKEATEIFIHHQPVPLDNFVWNVERPDSSNLSEVAAYLKVLSSLLESAKVCEAVTSYKQYWDSCLEQGFAKLEPNIYAGEECLRSEDCKVIYMEAKRCVNCERLRLALKKRHARVLQASTLKDAKKINNKFLPRKLLLKKTVLLAAEKKSLTKKLEYMRKKIRKLISKHTFNVDQEFSEDISKILNENAHKMSDIQKLFWSEQLRAISRQKNPRSVRWCPMMIKIAIHLQSISPAAYEYLQESGILVLPSRRRLYDFTHFAEAKDGIQEHIIDRIKEELDKPGAGDEEYKRYFNLLFDEMTIRSNLVVSRNGDIVGYTSLTEVENSIKNIESYLSAENPEELVPEKNELAKKALVFMLQGISSKVHAVVGIYSTGDLSAQQLYTRVWDVVYHLESRLIKVLCLICDGASCNRKFFNMHEKWDLDCQFTYATKNLASGENRPIFFIVDPPHLMKTLRNCLSNSHAHTHSREMVKNGQSLSWEAIERLYQVSVQDKYKNHKLTMAHIKLTAFSRMNVKLATQTTSNSVSSSLLDYKDDPRLNGLATPALIDFLSTVNIFFDCLNGSNDPDGKRNKVNKNLLPYTDENDSRFQDVLIDQVLKFFQDWHDEIQSKPNLKPEDKEKMMISHQAYESLHITVLGFCGAVQYLLKLGAPSVDAKDFNQDKLEQYFGIMRQKRGGDNNLTFLGVTQRSNVLDAAQPAALSGKKGNTLCSRGPLGINQQPLPVRQQKRSKISC